MKANLVRFDAKESGIYGVLNINDIYFCHTLEHSYGIKPKVPTGNYTCVRGLHFLHSGPIETFELLGVPGHSGILIHPGNDESSSAGCILVGRPWKDILLDSRHTFNNFMLTMKDVEIFTLSIENEKLGDK